MELGKSSKLNFLVEVKVEENFVEPQRSVTQTEEIKPSVTNEEKMRTSCGKLSKCWSYLILGLNWLN